MCMKKIIRQFFAPLLLLFVCAAYELDGREPGWRIDFSDPAVLKNEWQFNGALPFVRHTDFYLAAEPTAEDGMVAVIEAKRSSGLLMSAPPVDLARYPVMRWRWRIIRRINWPAGGRQEPDDQAGALCIGDGDRVRQQCVAYSWEHNTPGGSERFLRYRAGLLRLQRYCMRNHRDKAGEWVVETRDIGADFQRVFKRPIGKRFVLCIAGNSQHTKSNTRLEIDYIEFLPREKKSSK